MELITAQDSEARSADVIADNLDKLRVLFPELITEGPNGASVNVDVLKQLVGDHTVTDADEKYGLSWHGKRRSRQLALTPSTGTLRPASEGSVDWDTTQNLMIEGDNLEVLKLLQKSYAGRVKLIYIDPPYNTGKDFVYRDNFKNGSRKHEKSTGQADEEGRLVSNPETSGRYHTDWLNMIYPRLALARELLCEDGLVVVHIDEHEAANLQLALNELFGEENFLGDIVWDKKNPKGDARGVAYQHETLYLYARDAEALFSTSPLKRSKRNAVRMIEAARKAVSRNKTIEDARQEYSAWVRDQDSLSGGEAMYNRLDEGGRVYRLVSMAWPSKKQAPDHYFIPLTHPVSGRPCPVPARGWRNPPDTMQALLDAGRIEFGDDETVQPQRRYFLDENMDENVPSVLRSSESDDKRFEQWGLRFDHPKPTGFATDIVSWFSGGNDIVMDFFAGSGTTGHATWMANARDGGTRSFILVQLPESHGDDGSSLTDVTQSRLRLAATEIASEASEPAIDLGFRVYKYDSSNIRAWTPDPDDIEGTLAHHIEHLVSGRTEEDLLVELLLKRGLDLCTPIETREIAGAQTYSVGAGTLFAALPESLSRDEAEALAEGIAIWHDELDPAGDTITVVRDAAFADDVAKSNFAAILNQHGVAAVRSL